MNREQDMIIDSMQEEALLDMTLSLLVSSAINLDLTKEQCLAKLIECWEFHVNE